MTGYGAAEGSLKDKTIRVEIKSLNSRYTDIRVRFPFDANAYEIELRKRIQQRVLRGKIEYTLHLSEEHVADLYKINQTLLQKYLDELRPFLERNQLSTEGLLSSLVTLPEIVQQSELALSTEDWHSILEVTERALDALHKYRKDEGASIEAFLRSCLKNMHRALTEIDQYEDERIEKIRQRLREALLKEIPPDSVDYQRFHQELIYYLEKLDVSEEKSRLAHHLQYFETVLHDTSSMQKGKKLGFIAQEMGREINTLGAKASHEAIQKLVVELKDEHEKIKEQINNIV